jgi:dihydropyrimidine dehydrogenase (NAD+) subunit PreA
VPQPGHAAPDAELARQRLAADPHYRTPWIDESECIGCNLCSLVCPVHACLTMQPIDQGRAFESWNQRVRRHP